MNIRKKYLTQALLFSVIFITLLVIATFFDLQISHLLAGNDLKDGVYFSTNIFGRILEYFGSYPIFVFGIFACLVFMHNVYHLKNKKKYFSLFFIGIIVIVCFKAYSDTLEYILENHALEHIFELSLTKILLLVGSLLTTFLLVYFYRRVNLEKNNHLLTFAYVILCVCLFYVSIELIKGPVGRMRYRAMNLINDFTYFTPWYQISDAKEIVNYLVNVSVPKDGFKSFPSGHTFSAGVSYVLICLPYVYKKFDTSKWRALWYIIPLAFTGLVAISRIIVGAHFFSDVLVGGTIAYVASEVFKYIFFVRKLNQ